MPSESRTAPLTITLALEGGGALGAFTWGVLDRLLAEPGLRIAAVSGTSAGAMNAAMLVQGLVSGGPSGAGRLLEHFWHRVAIASGSLPGLSGRWMDSLSAGMAPMFDAMRRAGSAFTDGVVGGGVGFDVNPLRGILGELLRPESFGAAGAPTLLVAATRVRTGEARLFRGAEVTSDALLASACLPMLFPAVEIDGEPYWDGGYSSNPPVRALIEAGAPGDVPCGDVLIVRTMPTERAAVPSGARAVKNRLHEITFGTPLRAELLGLARAQASLRAMGTVPPPLARLRDARLHMIEPEQAADGMAALNPSWGFVTAQRALGHDSASRWLARHRDDLGERATLDLSAYAETVPPAGQGRARRAGFDTAQWEGTVHAT